MAHLHSELNSRDKIFWIEMVNVNKLLPAKSRDNHLGDENMKNRQFSLVDSHFCFFFLKLMAFLSNSLHSMNIWINSHHTMAFLPNKNVLHRQNGREISFKKTHTQQIYFLSIVTHRIGFHLLSRTHFFQILLNVSFFDLTRLVKWILESIIRKFITPLRLANFLISTSICFWQRVAERASRMIL